jgi:hypothetical protein
MKHDCGILIEVAAEDIGDLIMGWKEATASWRGDLECFMMRSRRRVG